MYFKKFIITIPQKWTSSNALHEIPGRTKLGIILLNKEMNVTRSLLGDIKTKQLQ
jgi:hypothetical protein